MNSREAYATDLTDAQWNIVEPLLPVAKTGRPRLVSLREVLNTIFYLLRTGCAWRLLPHDLVKWPVAYYYFRRWQKGGTWSGVNAALSQQLRVQEGKQPTPSAAILDSQSVKSTPVPGARGYDAGKKINGRKRHILVDTLGLIWAVVVHTADVQDRQGAKTVLAKIRDRMPRLRLVWADGGYTGQLLNWVSSQFTWTLVIVKRSDQAQGFTLLPRRWIVERTFGWLTRYRRLSKEYEQLTSVSESMIYATMIHLMLRRLRRS